MYRIRPLHWAESGRGFERWFFRLRYLNAMTQDEYDQFFERHQRKGYIPIEDLLEEARNNQPDGWNPRAPRYESAAHNLFYLVKVEMMSTFRMDKHTVKTCLSLYVSVGKGLDVLENTDCFFQFVYPQVFATVDITKRSDKKPNRADIILTKKDIESGNCLVVAREIAELLHKRYILHVEKKEIEVVEGWGPGGITSEF